MKVRLAPSILSADPTSLLQAVRLVEDLGADLIHVDIMDGHFVPNLTFGPGLVSALKKKTSLPLDVHLMVNDPSRLVPLFLKAGADWISIHVEASTHLQADLQQIKDAGKKAGLALNPGTSILRLSEILPELDFVLVMCVNPGWGSQALLPACPDKIRRMSRWLKGQKLDIPLAVDGGVKAENIEGLVRDGADVLVVGSAIFNSPDPGEAFRKIKQAAERGQKP
ncbi:MAG TPA: ribulose-phosphate 3-epimerase [Acidobacteriota bacterium]